MKKFTLDQFLSLIGAMLILPLLSIKVQWLAIVVV